MSAICGHCGAESPTVGHKCPTSAALPTATFGVYSKADNVELEIDRSSLGPMRVLLDPVLATQLAAELLFIASRVAGKGMRPAFNKYLRDRKGPAE